MIIFVEYPTSKEEKYINNITLGISPEENTKINEMEYIFLVNWVQDSMVESLAAHIITHNIF